MRACATPRRATACCSSSHPKPVLIVDASTLRIVEANPAAMQLLGLNGRKRRVAASFPRASTPTARMPSRPCSPTCAHRTGGRRARAPADGSRDLLVSASLFRAGAPTLLLVTCDVLRADRLAESCRGAPQLCWTRRRARPTVSSSPIRRRQDPDGQSRVPRSRAIATEEQARGESLDRWLGRPGVDLNVLLTQSARARLGARCLRRRCAAQRHHEDVEIVAVRRCATSEPAASALRCATSGRGGSPRPAPRIVPFRRTVHRTGRPCAAEGPRARDHATSSSACASRRRSSSRRTTAPPAAEMLGLSRQSLYVKLRRYGLGDLVDSEGDF